MTNITRRRFFKSILASVAALTSFKYISISPKVELQVDQDGNATLIGAEMVVGDHEDAVLE